MKRIAVAFGFSLFLMMPSWLMAQGYHRNHGEIGVYADYLHFAPGNYNNNYVGVGGRVAFNVHPNIALEAEMNYDFARNFTTPFNNGVTTAFVKTKVRPLTGLFGPKFQIGTSSAFRAFVEGKVGFIDFSTSNNAQEVTGGTFTAAIGGIGGGGTHFAVFPGGGVEGFWGPIGLRLDVGDEIYMADGVNNNLRVTFGPTIRF